MADLQVGHQFDYTTDVLYGARFDDAGVVHHCSGKRIRSPCGNEYLPAVGRNHAAVADQRTGRAGIDVITQQCAVVEIQGDGVTCDQRNRALRRSDAAGVGYGRGDQGDVASIGGIERALVVHLAGANHTAVAEHVVARHEIGVADVQGRCDQAADVHLCGAAEQYAVRIQNKDLAVGTEITEDLTRVLTEDTVEGDGRRVGLVEVHGFVAADAEALPIDGEVLSLLGDSGGGACLGDAARACADLSVHGCGERRG